MPNVTRVPIINIYMGGDYTGVICVGPEKKTMNVILDTRSSALALDGAKYQPDLAGGDQSTDLAQTDSYGDGSTWTGAVIKTTLTMGTNNSSVALQGGNAAIAYQASSDMFGSTAVPGPRVCAARRCVPDAEGYVERSIHFHSSAVGQSERLGSLPDSTRGRGRHFGQDSVLHPSFVRPCWRRKRERPFEPGMDDSGWRRREHRSLYRQLPGCKGYAWYCTNLKEVIVGSSSPIAARIQEPRGMPSNSIIDSGTNSLNLGPQMLNAILSKFPAAQKQLLAKAIDHGDLVSVSDLKLDQWPTITFVLQGDAGDVKLDVPPSNYWQVNTQKVGYAAAGDHEGPGGAFHSRASFDERLLHDLRWRSRRRQGRR